MSLRLRRRRFTIVAAVATVLATVASVPASATSSVPIRIVRPAAVLTVTTTSLPPATLGYRYSATLQASGGTPPYLWIASQLPAGLVLSSSGVLSGTPRDLLGSSIVFTAIDSLKNRAESPVIKFAALAPLSPSGQLFDWGANDSGQLGTGDGADRLLPVPIPGLTSVAAVSGNADVGYALMADRTVSDWGSNVDGQLGDGTMNQHLMPKAVPGVAGVLHLAAGWGGPLVALSNRTVWGWGYNGLGQEGINCPDVGDSNPVPLQIPGASSVIGVAFGLNGYELSSGGTVWGQGENEEGELGTPLQPPDIGNVTVCPAEIPGLTGVTAIAAGWRTAYALRSDGTVWAWGDNTAAQLGVGSNTPIVGPVQVSGLPTITAISAGSSTGYALAADGTVWAWGSNSLGAVGDGSLSPAPAYSPVQVTGLTSITKIAGGRDSGYALRSDGTVWAWGSGSHGQLGTGSIASSVKPVQVQGLAGIVGIGSGPFSVSGYAIKGS
jgi:alpha-tubulin suppressor-like RCC1 family protein